MLMPRFENIFPWWEQARSALSTHSPMGDLVPQEADEYTDGRLDDNVHNVLFYRDLFSLLTEKPLKNYMSKVLTPI